jgi:hypothetical protein
MAPKIWYEDVDTYTTCGGKVLLLDMRSLFKCEENVRAVTFLTIR